MYKKEFSEIWPPVVARLGVGFLPPLAAWIAKREFDAAVAYLLLFGLIVAIGWIANTLGLNAFKAEKSDRAWEYLFTFPYGRLRLLAYKAGPRVLILAGLLGLYLLASTTASPLMQDIHDRALFSPRGLALITLVIFVSGFSLSLFDQRNFRIFAGAPWFLFYLFLCEGVSRILLHAIPDRAARALLVYAVGALIVVAITGISFWRTFCRLDLQGESMHLRRYLATALPPAMLVFVVTLWVLIRK